MTFQMHKICLTLALTAASLSAVPAIAHHSSAPHFDRSKTLEFTGTVTEMKFVNPHSYLYVDVVQDGETVNWRCELSAATLLQRRGWSADMFDGGETVSVTGSPAWREDNVCLLSTMSINGASEITRGTTLGSSTAAANAELDAPRDKYRPNGEPNFSGAWLTKSFGRDSIGRPPNYRPTEEGRKLMETYDMRFDDPVLKCHFVNIFKAWSHDSNVNKIEQTDTTLTLTYGFMDLVRTIHLDQDAHPDDLQPSMAGHSIGRWEGEKLIVETIGFEPGVLDHTTGIMHSADLRTVETFYMDEETGYLAREYVGYDSLLSQPAQGIDYMAVSAEAYEPYGCTELSGANNIRPEGVDASTLPGPRSSPMGGGPPSSAVQPSQASSPDGAGSSERQNQGEQSGLPSWMLAVLLIVAGLGLFGVLKARKSD